MDGKGIHYYENRKKIYESGNKENIIDGKGIIYFENGKKIYEGEFKAGDYHGKGIFYLNSIDGEKYDGKWVNGRKDGEFQVTNIATDRRL